MADRFPIRTLHLLPELKEGGLERLVIERTIMLQNRGVGALVVSKSGIWLDKLKAAGIRHIELPINNKSPFSIFKCARDVRKIIKDEDIHLVCANSRAPAWIGHLASRNGASHTPPLITEAEGYYELFYYSKVMGWGDRVITASRGIRDHMLKLGADPSRMVVIARGISVDSYKQPSPEARMKLRAQWGIPDDGMLIVGVGRLTHNKGWHDLIEAVGKLKNPNVYCVLVGSAKKRRVKYIELLETLINENNLTDNVKLVGHRDDMPDIYSAADCVAVPSLRPEGFGLVIIEALVGGTPVVTTRGCGAAEFLGDEFGRFLAEPGDAEGIAGCLDMIIKDPSGTSNDVDKFSQRIKTELTDECQFKATLDVFREIRPDLQWPEG